jgi:hypothetical protein
MHPLTKYSEEHGIDVFKFSELESAPVKSGIYGIWLPCHLPARAYIGQTSAKSGIRGRLANHRYSLERGEHSSPLFQLAYEGYETSDFVCAMLEEVSGDDPRSSYLNDDEIFLSDEKWCKNDVDAITLAEQKWMDIVTGRKDGEPWTTKGLLNAKGRALSTRRNSQQDALPWVISSQSTKSGMVYAPPAVYHLLGDW